MMMRHAVVAAGLLLALNGCSVGTGAVDVNNGGQFRFVAGTPSGKLIEAKDRGDAPSFSGELLDGSHFDSGTLAGDVAVINFWGQWCGPCRVETPEFQDVYADVASKGVSFLGVDVKDTQQMARAFVSGRGITYPSLSDPRGEIALIFKDYPPSSIPSTIILDKNGKVAAVYIGAVAQGDLRTAIDTLVAET